MILVKNIVVTAIFHQQKMNTTQPLEYHLSAKKGCQRGQGSNSHPGRSNMLIDAGMGLV